LSLVVKICGLTSEADVRACARAGADLFGVNLWPGSKRHVDLETARELVRAAPHGIEAVGVFVDADLETILEAGRVAGFTRVQLHGDESPALAAELVSAGLTVIRAVPVGPGADAEALREPWREAAYLLADAPRAGTPGGTGRRADWTVAAEMARLGPLLLAGGLDPENVADAIADVRPAGVDVASGVEQAPGEKDHGAVDAFVRAARRAAELPR